MKKVIELVREAIFQSFLIRHLNIISPTGPDGKLQDKYAPQYSNSTNNVMLQTQSDAADERVVIAVNDNTAGMGMGILSLLRTCNMSP